MPLGRTPVPPDYLTQSALSLAEMLVVVAVVAVLAAIAIPLATRILPSMSASTAQRNLNYLNGAVLKFNESNWELYLAPDAGSADEESIFNTLRYRAPTNAAPGSPYLGNNAFFTASSGTETYRAQWNGRMFDIIYPGSNGTGLDLMKVVGNPATNTALPTNFTPVGAR